MDVKTNFGVGLLIKNSVYIFKSYYFFYTIKKYNKDSVIFFDSDITYRELSLLLLSFSSSVIIKNYWKNLSPIICVWVLPLRGCNKMVYNLNTLKVESGDCYIKYECSKIDILMTTYLIKSRCDDLNLNGFSVYLKNEIGFVECDFYNIFISLNTFQSLKIITDASGEDNISFVYYLELDKEPLFEIKGTLLNGNEIFDFYK